jgi:hypothetical protein
MEKQYATETGRVQKARLPAGSFGRGRDRRGVAAQLSCDRENCDLEYQRHQQALAVAAGLARCDQADVDVYTEQTECITRAA